MDKDYGGDLDHLCYDMRDTYSKQLLRECVSVKREREGVRMCERKREGEGERDIKRDRKRGRDNV